MRLPTLPVLLFVTLAFAGCSDGNDAKAQREAELDAAAQALDLEATETTGVVRGVVVNSAIAPVPGAEVTLRGAGGEQRATTDDNGAFGFEDLAPATYFLTARKFGYLETQSSAEVVAGVDDPPVIKVQLLDNLAERASYDLFEFAGFLQCSASVGTPVTSGLFTPCEFPVVGPVGDDNSNTRFVFEGNSSWIHTTLVWGYTNPAGAQLYYNVFCPQGYQLVGYTRGTSPLINDVGSEAEDLECFDDDGVIGFEVAADRFTTQGFLGLALNQAFQVYIVNFHGFTPPEGYQFHRDGEPAIPE